MRDDNDPVFGLIGFPDALVAARCRFVDFDRFRPESRQRTVSSSNVGKAADHLAAVIKTLCRSLGCAG
jgi:hypothetical protein